MPPLFVLGIGLGITRIASGVAFLSDYAFFMEWFDILKFILIENIKKLILLLANQTKRCLFN